MEYFKRITQYFRTSLIDAERLSPSDREILPALNHEGTSKKANYVSVENTSWHEGRINSDLTNTLIQKRSGKAVETEIIIFPRVDMLSYQKGKRPSHKRQVLLPLGVAVRLQPDGTLRPSDKAPWVPREWLAPNLNDSECVAEVAELDKFFTENPFETVENWGALVTYCSKLLAFVTNQKGADLESFKLLSDYECVTQSLVQVEIPATGVSANIIKALDILLDTKEALPKLYTKLCSRKMPPLGKFHNRAHNHEYAKKHLGQMTGEFSLAPNQRNALHHFMDLEEGGILAVNGPPGTGKTTLLRSVVANLWTQAALDEKEPPLIVAASNNNQAVTNILESFGKIDEKGINESLKGRWLPEVDSYGLYCCAGSKATKDNPYLYLSGDKGCMQGWQTEAFIKRSNELFMERAKAWKTVDSVSQTKKLLHMELKGTQQTIVGGIEKLSSFQDVELRVNDKHGSFTGLIKKIKLEREREKTALDHHNQAKNKVSELYSLWDERGLFVRLLMWLPLINKQEYRKNRLLLNQWGIELESQDDHAVEKWAAEQVQATRAVISQIKQKLTMLESLQIDYEDKFQNMKRWISEQSNKSSDALSFENHVHDINDCILRFKMFKLATHYWEARWLLEMNGFDKNDDKKSPTKVERKLRRFAKLTPCFVSTFYMLPSTFMAGKFEDKVWQDVPLFSTIDLLIVDEAGQASPEVSAASFAYAKRALIVGDTDQIEPVWSVPVSIDRANLRALGLFELEEEYDDFWLNSGLLASSGNIMSVAQRQCSYHQVQKLQRGLYLTEHRRCYDSIIGYCNSLVYDGVLEAFRGEPTREVPWGTMKMIPVISDSGSIGGSRGNLGEAESIAQWVNSEKDNVIKYAKVSEPKNNEKSNDEILSQSIGIITPFSRQATMIRNELKNANITGITVGTVHSLQGAERLIVIFSSVYGENDKGASKFYDRGGNMLNVAVSRAKDSFIVFGHANVFGKDDPNAPSGKLRAILQN